MTTVSNVAFVTQFTSEHYFCSWLVLFVYDRFVGLYHAHCSPAMHIAQARPMMPCISLVSEPNKGTRLGISDGNLLGLGASLSEPHMVSSTRALSVCLSVGLSRTFPLNWNHFGN